MVPVSEALLRGASDPRLDRIVRHLDAGGEERFVFFCRRFITDVRRDMGISRERGGGGVYL